MSVAILKAASDEGKVDGWSSHWNGRTHTVTARKGAKVEEAQNVSEDVAAAEVIDALLTDKQEAAAKAAAKEQAKEQATVAERQERAARQ